MFASKSPMFINVSSKNHHWIINEAVIKTILLRRFAPRKDKSSLLFASKSSLFQQCFFEDSSTTLTKIHWSTKETSTFGRLAQHNFYWSIIFPSNFLLFIKISSKNHQRNNNEAVIKTFLFRRLATQKDKSSLLFASKSPLCQQGFFEESSANHQRRSKETWNFRRLAP